MPRTYKAKGVHTNPEDAGAKNLEGMNIPKDEDGIMAKLMPIYKHKEPYKGRWTTEQLADSISEFFDYCYSVDFKPTQPALRVWLGISRQQFNEWRVNKDGKYGDKSDVINTAVEIMESYLQANIDKYPTGSIFLLKTSYGHVEQSKLDITTNGESVKSATELNDMVSKLGLDK